MTKVLVLYYSSYGHVEAMALAAAEGVQEMPDAIAVVKRVPELVPDIVAENSGYKRDQKAPLAEIGELAEYDAIMIGTPTRFGSMASQMKQFLDQAGGLWAQDRLVGKVGAAFTSTATQHGGHESTILSVHTVLLHFGMVVVGLPYSFKAQMEMGSILGGSPYGAGTVAAPDGSRFPSDNDLAGARFQGRYVTEIAAGLAHRRLTSAA